MIRGDPAPNLRVRRESPRADPWLAQTHAVTDMLISSLARGCTMTDELERSGSLSIRYDRAPRGAEQRRRRLCQPGITDLIASFQNLIKKYAWVDI